MALGGFPLGMAFVVRPTLGAVLVLAGLALLFADRRAAAWFAAAASAVVVPAIALNLFLYDSAIVPYYLPGSGPVVSGVSPTLGDGLLGTLASPGRGLFVFTPFLLFAGFGLWLRRRSLGWIDVVAIGAIGILWVGTANTLRWEGGASYGPRLLTDTLAFWAYLLAPVFGLVVRAPRLWTRRAGVAAVLLALTVGFSVFVHARGSLSWAPHNWNHEPTTALDEARHRIWDWSDLQFLRGGPAEYEDHYPPGVLAAPAVAPDRICYY